MECAVITTYRCNAHCQMCHLVSPGSVEALAEAMSWIAAHLAEAREMEQKAQSYVLAHHGPEQHYRRLMDMYGQVRGETG